MHKWQNVIGYSSYVKSCPYSVFFFVLFFLHSRVLFTVHTEAPGQKGRQRRDACLMR